jgi:DNA polymerase III subunit gamma/tau
MAWICVQEGVSADAEVLAVLAQAGEGSVRDSLSALDQAIACCGTKLDAAEVRALLGAFSLESLEQVSEALVKGDSTRMLEVVDELERNGHNLQHFSREISRYFRNLLVTRIAGPGASRLIAASEAQRQKLAETAARFSEEDLTRYLQLSLELFRDLQFSLQPRFHLEIGLLRMVHAGRLLPIEQALAEFPGGGGAAKPLPSVTAREEKASVRDQAVPSRDRQGAASPDLPGPNRLHAHLTHQGLAHLADAVENSRIVAAGGELQIATAKTYAIYFRDPKFLEAVREIYGRPLKLQVTVSDDVGQTVGQALSPAGTEDALTQRALANPEVQRFQEAFPGSKVYKVRNLKE